VPKVRFARRRGTRVRTDRSRNCAQKQSSPYIHRMQHTVLSVRCLKGTISEFELNLFRQRSSEAILQKARRGELQVQIPVGFCWAPNGRIEKDPDQRVQQAIQLVFRKMTELSSVHQVLVWCARGRRPISTREHCAAVISS
jgi:hypothetical protein